jgi:hypothetical protein
MNAKIEYEIENTNTFDLTKILDKNIDMTKYLKNVVVSLDDKLSNEYFDGKYKGLKINGNREGPGIFNYNNGDVYIGLFKNNKICGEGAFYYKTGRICIGDFNNNKFHGTIYNENGDIYKGSTNELGLREGKGTYTYKCGGKFEGFYENGSKIIGSFTFKNGDIYTGPFKNDKFYGNGKINYVNGNEFEGFFENSKKNGLGEYKYKDGGSYTCKYSNDLIDSNVNFTDNKKNNYIINN